MNHLTTTKMRCHQTTARYNEKQSENETELEIPDFGMHSIPNSHRTEHAHQPIKAKNSKFDRK